MIASFLINSQQNISNSSLNLAIIQKESQKSNLLSELDEENISAFQKFSALPIEIFRSENLFFRWDVWCSPHLSWWRNCFLFSLSLKWNPWILYNITFEMRTLDFRPYKNTIVQSMPSWMLQKDLVSSIQLLTYWIIIFRSAVNKSGRDTSGNWLGNLRMPAGVVYVPLAMTVIIYLKPYVPLGIWSSGWSLIEFLQKHVKDRM